MLTMNIPLLFLILYGVNLVNDANTFSLWLIAGQSLPAIHQETVPVYLQVSSLPVFFYHSL